MKILVIEDNPLHAEAAKAQLAGHELTVYSSWKKLMSYRGMNSKYINDPEKHLKFLRGFDMVMTDINFPGILDTDKSEPEAPIGLALILRAVEAGVRYIGGVTDKGHHTDALTKSFAMWIYHEKPFVMGNSKVIIKDDFIAYERIDDEHVVVKQWKKAFDFLVGSDIAKNES